MARPWKHPTTGVYYLRKGVPERLRKLVGAREIKISLGTKSRAEAITKFPEAMKEADRRLRGEHRVERPLTQRQVHALAGVWLNRELATHADEPGHWSKWSDRLDKLQEAEGRNEVDALVEADLTELLQRESLTVDAAARAKLVDALFDAQVNLAKTMLDRSEGNYRTPDAITSLPKWEHPKTAEAKTVNTDSPVANFDALLGAWARERNPVEKTRYSWERIVSQLRNHLDHDEPAHVTKSDIVAWKMKLLETGDTAKTVTNKLIVARTLFGRAVKNDYVPTNPAAGVEVAIKEHDGNRRLSYTTEDAQKILSAARGEVGSKRWVPWLLAFSGARLEEVCALKVANVRREGEVWYLDLNTVRGAGKNRYAPRRVPLHRSVIAEGFLDYVKGLKKDGPLFPDVPPDRSGKRSSNGTKTIGRWVRGLGFTDERKAPNHAWRHRFKDICRAAKVEKWVHDALTGHQSSDEGDRYGSEGVPLDVLSEAIGKLPPVFDDPKPARTKRRASAVVSKDVVLG